MADIKNRDKNGASQSILRHSAEEKLAKSQDATLELREKSPEEIIHEFPVHQIEVDFRIFTHSGEERWIEHRSQPVFGDDGRWLGRRASNRDITYRKQVEEEKSSLIIELQNALAQVKKLSGFIPICSSCKKIRDDKGYWRQVEEYVSEHSEALFSHGICPDCIRKLYPEIADEVLGRLEKDKKK